MPLSNIGTLVVVFGLAGFVILVARARRSVELLNGKMARITPIEPTDAGHSFLNALSN